MKRPQADRNRAQADRLRRLTSLDVIGPTALRILAAVCRRPGFPPSVHELCAELGVTPNAVATQVRVLKAAGLLTGEPRRARTWRPAFRFLTPDRLGEGGQLRP